MGQTTIPCPGCFQAQTVIHDNGQEILPRFCAACAEDHQLSGLSEEDFIAAKHGLTAKAKRAKA